MLSMHLKTTYPPGATGGGNPRRSFRNIQAGRGRRTLTRGLRKIRSNGAIHPHIADSLSIFQATQGADFEMGYASDHPGILPYMEGTGPAVGDPAYWPPWSANNPDALRFRTWADEQGWNPYMLARHVFLHGTPPHPELGEEMDEIADEVEQSWAEGFYAWAAAYGDERVAERYA